jgi:hypothetical protein
MFDFHKFFNESTLEYHKELNPLLWADEKFDAAARVSLLRLADFWREEALIPKDAVKDILIVGGNANYNYTKYSDLDLHILVDKDKIPDCDEEILDEFLKDKKKLWGLTHDVKIFGIPVEVYAQGLDEKYGKNQGVYSLKSNKWIQKPQRERLEVNDSVVAKKAKDMIHKIEFFINNKVDKPDIIRDFKEKLRRMRQSAVRQGGEFSVENLAFKEVRNKGYIDKLQSYLEKLEDKQFSLKKGDKVSRKDKS